MPQLTCEAVLTEACFLVRHVPHGAANILELLDRKALIVPFCLEDESKAVAELMSRYQSVPMSLADACLVRMAEQFPSSKVLTIDSDFTIYRKNRRQRIPTLMPFDSL